MYFMKSNITLTIVVPCHNEAANIPLLLQAYSDVILRDDIEVILVNDGSVDETHILLQKLGPRYPFLKVVTIDKSCGYGSAVMSGLKSASGEFIGWTHGDLQTPPRDVVKALEIIEARGNDPRLYIKGRRYGRPFFDRVFTWGMSIFETVYMGVWLVDINAQPNIFHKSFFATWKNPPSDFSLDLYVLYTAQKEKLEIVRFDVPFLERVHGESKWNTGLVSKWKFIKRTMEFSIKLKGSLK